MYPPKFFNGNIVYINTLYKEARIIDYAPALSQWPIQMISTNQGLVIITDMGIIEAIDLSSLKQSKRSDIRPRKLVQSAGNPIVTSVAVFSNNKLKIMGITDPTYVPYRYRSWSVIFNLNKWKVEKTFLKPYVEE